MPANALLCRTEFNGDGCGNLDGGIVVLGLVRCGRVGCGVSRGEHVRLCAGSARPMLVIDMLVQYMRTLS